MCSCICIRYLKPVKNSPYFFLIVEETMLVLSDCIKNFPFHYPSSTPERPGLKKVELSVLKSSRTNWWKQERKRSVEITSIIVSLLSVSSD